MSNLLNLLIDIEDQRHYNSCGGQALSTYLEAIWFKFTGERREFSAAFIWRMALYESGKTGNVGVTIDKLFLVLTKYGCCLESDYPYTDENLQRMPPDDVIKKAAQFKIKTWKTCKLEHINSYIDSGLPVFCFMNMPTGHFVDVFGYDGDKRLVVNSWGTQWKDSGVYWMPETEFKPIFRSAIVITRVDGFFKLIGRKLINLFNRKK